MGRPRAPLRECDKQGHLLRLKGGQCHQARGFQEVAGAIFQGCSDLRRHCTRWISCISRSRRRCHRGAFHADYELDREHRILEIQSNGVGWRPALDGIAKVSLGIDLRSVRFLAARMARADARSARARYTSVGNLAEMICSRRQINGDSTRRLCAASSLPVSDRAVSGSTQASSSAP